MSKYEERETECKTEWKVAIHNCSTVEPEIEECKCTECGRTFKNGKGLKIHISKTHGKPSCQITSNVKTPKSTIERETKFDTQFQCQKLDKNQDHDGCNSIISKEKVPVMLDEEPSSLKSSDNQQETEKDGFKCNHCEQSFKTIRGLKTHVSKSHKVSTKNGHDNPSLPVNEDTSDNAAVEKKENSDEDVLQKEDSVEACSNEDEESVLDDSELVSSPIIEDTSMLSCVQSAVFKCNLNEKSFKTNRGLKTHVSKSHKVSTKIGHEGPEKKRKSSTDGDEFQNEDIVAPSSYECEESVLGVQSSLFKCNMCEKSFKTNRGLKTHVSKSHKVSAKNGHDSPVLPINEDTSDTERPGKKEKSSADEDKCQNEDIVEARSNNAEGSVLVESKSPYSTDDYEDAVLPESDVESGEETNSESLKASVERDTRPVSTKTKRIVDKLKKENSLTKSETSVAVTETKKLVDTFFEHLRVISPTLKWQRFNSGSYYDKTKNDQADEFDIMIYPDNIQVEVNFDSPISGFYKVKFESPRVEENLKNQVETNGYIHPGKFKEYVFGLFDQVFQSTEHHMFRRVTKKERSDNSSPAYTIFYNGIPGKSIDIDLVPCFRINTWPCIARKINPTWIHSKLGNIVNDAIKCYDVVSKTCPDDVEDSHLFWRLSFSYTEKKLVNSANSVDRFSTKKTIFRLIKSLIQELKDNNPAIMKKFCSYHIKQFMFKQYDTWGEIYDHAKILRNVLQKLLEQLSSSPPFIENYFIEKDNVIRYVPQPEIALIVKFLQDKMKVL
ncbi:cyclic GMP-AMP synthase [Mytilus galloprovincialis]|uniref:Cyclic GMP-AMP synthase n=1 Tax=Mytilus galloprovincialis TaxID=29158 RepID=A0A8B6BN20_MYTGA|nr:cyclic GMP-AMP synthase [Mytilus galloprovincialis]